MINENISLVLFDQLFRPFGWRKTMRDVGVRVRVRGGVRVGVRVGGRVGVRVGFRVRGRVGVRVGVMVGGRVKVGVRVDGKTSYQRIYTAYPNPNLNSNLELTLPKP
jgi:hypothetical protein